MKKQLVQFCQGEDGVTVIEYGVIGVLIGIVAVATILVIGTQVAALFASVVF
jgi:Flp pilus assembly pilin Flp